MELIIQPIWRTGICRIAMKRGAVVDECHLGGVAHKQDDAFVGDGDGLLRNAVEPNHFEGLGGEGADHANAAEVFFHHLGQIGQLVLKPQPASAQFDAGDRGPDADDGDEAQGQQSQGQVDVYEDGGAAANQHGQQEQPQDTGIDPQTHPLDIEDATGHEVAAVDPIVPGKTESLQLAVIVEPEVIADHLANRLALVVLHHGEEAAQHAGAHQQQGGVKQGVPCRLSGIAIDRAGQQALDLVDRLAHVLGHEQLEDSR
jgi:hypothetical protein